MREIAEQFLRSSLLDLHSRLHAVGINIILGGGFGLFVKQLDLLTEETPRTLLPVEAWPRPRTTNDLDLFVPLELLATLADMQAVRRILDELEFQAIAGSEFWQFVLPDTDVKIDLLTGPITEAAKPQLKLDSRRVRPKGNIKLHARQTPEALGLGEYQEAIKVHGQLADGSEYSGLVTIPSPFTYLMMKITALGDQVDNERRIFGRHHALDVYRIIAMLHEEQYTQTRKQFEKYWSEPSAQRVILLARELLASTDSPGMVRMREHAFYENNLDIAAFISALQDLTKPLTA